MQATTMTDIKEMEKNIPEVTLVGADNVDTLDEVTTAPQEQLEQLDSQTPKQPIGNETPQAK